MGINAQTRAPSGADGSLRSQILSALATVPEELNFDKISFSAFEGTSVNIAISDPGLESIAIPKRFSKGMNPGKRCVVRLRKTAYAPNPPEVCGGR